MPTPGHVLNPNKPATRFRGPLLVGAPAEMSQAAVNGVSTEPLISFWNAPEFGMYVNSSAQVRITTPGAADSPVIITSGAFHVGSTLRYTAASSGMLLVIPFSSATMSSGTIPADLNGGVGIVAHESSAGSTQRLQLWLVSSAIGWMTLVSTAGGAGLFFSSTST